jgi:MarR family transcriptional regulator, organic hydroperoxide resistance regulator
VSATDPQGGGTIRPAVRRLYEALRHASAAERRLRGGTRGPDDLSFPKLRALVALAREHELTAGELARSAELKPATMTTLLDQLEAAGIVRRTRSSADRRLSMVSLTDTGSELVQRRIRAWQEHWNRRLSAISDEELETAARVLDEVAALYEAAPHELTDAD